MSKKQSSPIPYSFTDYARDIVRFIKPYRRKFIAGSLLRLTSDIANLYPAWALSQIVLLLTGTVSTTDYQRVWSLVLGWAVVVIYFALAHALAKWFGYQVAERVALDVRIKALQHIFSLDIAWQEKENTGNKLKRIDHGSRALDQSIRNFFDVVIEAGLNSVGMLIIFTILGWELGIALVIFMITYFVLSSIFTKKGSDQHSIVNAIEEDLEGLSFESINNIKTVKSLSIQQTMSSSLKEQTERAYKAIVKRITIFRMRSGILNGFYLLFQLGMIGYIITQIFEGRYEASLLILFVGYFGKVEEAVGELAEITHELVIAKVQFFRLKSILATKPTIEAHPAETLQLPMPSNWKRIEFKDVSFSYEDTAVLHNFDLTIKRGQKIGIVGLSGAGKSTLFNLLLDLYESYSGEILVDTIPLTSIKRQDYIDHLAVVLQDTELFNASLRENILIGHPPGRAVDERVLKNALQTAYLNEVIDRLPKGADTIIGEKGVKLSGGEKQRLGIARALYRQPDLLLMDEATSHLDVESEKKIQASLHEFFNQVTAVVIAHRLSTIKEMDLIVVMQGGKIVEQGSFEKLIRKQGMFAQLWEKQQL